ncbi:MAG TPA: hypothetical protein VN366_02405 [Feifaniaceae bacterium]|nr:hypothetical protein [Feifaniaceae bacterium]
MIMEFKKSKIIYFILLAVTCALILALLIPRASTVDGRLTYTSLISGGRPVESVILRWIFILFGLFLAQMVSSAAASSIGNKEFQKIASRLLKDCDAEAFFRDAGPLFKKGSRQTDLVKYYLIGKGYIAQGEYGKAVALLDAAQGQADVEWITHDMRVSLCGVYSNACIGYAETGDNDAAVRLYSRLKAVADATVNNRDAYAAADEMRLATRDYIAVFAKEGFDDTAALRQHIEKARTEYERVIYHYALARLCERVGQQKEADRSYRYVAANGNTFACAAAAKARLRERGITLKKEDAGF